MAKTLIDILVSKKILDLSEASQIRKEAKEKNVPTDDILYQHGVKEADVAGAKAEFLNLPVKILAGASVPSDVLRDIPEESSRHYQMIPLGKTEGFLNVGMLHPDDPAAQEALKFISARTGLPTRIFVIIPSDFENVLREYKSLTGEVTKALGEFEKEYESLDEEVKRKKEEPVKITIIIDQDSLNFFKETAARLGAKYQRMIREVLKR